MCSGRARVSARVDAAASSCARMVQQFGLWTRSESGRSARERGSSCKTSLCFLCVRAVPQSGCHIRPRISGLDGFHTPQVRTHESRVHRNKQIPAHAKPRSPRAAPWLAGASTPLLLQRGADAATAHGHRIRHHVYHCMRPLQQDWQLSRQLVSAQSDSRVVACNSCRQSFGTTWTMERIVHELRCAFAWSRLGGHSQTFATSRLHAFHCHARIPAARHPRATCFVLAVSRGTRVNDAAASWQCARLSLLGQSKAASSVDTISASIAACSNSFVR